MPPERQKFEHSFDQAGSSPGQSSAGRVFIYFGRALPGLLAANLGRGLISVGEASAARMLQQREKDFRSKFSRLI